MNTIKGISLEDIYFVSPKHKDNLIKLTTEIYSEANRSRDYLVACYVIAHPEIYHKATKKASSYPFDEWVNNQDFSSGFQKLVALGFHIYNGGQYPFNLSDGLATWDDELFKVFLQTCKLWR